MKVRDNCDICGKSTFDLDKYSVVACCDCLEKHSNMILLKKKEPKEVKGL